MESLDFILVVVPLTIIVATLSLLVYYYAHKEEFNKRKTAKMIQGFLQTRVEQQAVIRRELGKMDEMYKTGNISKGTYQRLQNIIEMTQEKQRFETLFMLSDDKAKPKKESEITVEKILAETKEEVSQEQQALKRKEEVDGANVEQTPNAEKPKRIRKRKEKTDEKKETQLGLIAGEIAPEITDNLKKPISKN